MAFERCVLFLSLSMQLGCSRRTDARRIYEFAHRLEARVPGVPVSVIDPLRARAKRHDGAEIVFGIDNLNAICDTSPQECEAAMERQLRSAVSVLSPVLEPVSPDRLRITLKTRAWLEQIEPSSPDRRVADRARVDSTIADGAIVDSAVVSKPWIGSLCLVAVIDQPDSLRMLRPEDERQLGLDDAHVFERALQNLEAELPPPELIPFDDSAALKRLPANTYASSQLLLPRRFQSIAHELGGSILAAAPARHLVLIAGASSEGALRAASTELARSEPYNLTDDVYRWTPEAWVLVER